MRIGFCGSQGTGKTSVADYLSKLDIFEDFYFPPSSARTLSNVKINQKANALDQILITLDRYTNIISHHDVISDRTPVDSWAYSTYVNDPDMSGDYFPVVDRFTREAMKSIDLVVYFPVLWTPRHDGVRSMDVVYQQSIDALIIEGLHRFCPYHEIMIMENEPVEERSDKIVAAAEEMGFDLIR